MIAPIRELDEPSVAEAKLSEAARAAAATLLSSRGREEGALAVPAWQAWLLVAWVAATSAAYLAITLGWIR